MMGCTCEIAVSDSSDLKPQTDGQPVSSASTSTHKLDVVLTNGRNRIAYNILRSLGKAGLCVGVGVDSDGGMGVFSRFATARFRHPGHVSDELGFVETVRLYIQQYRPKVYIPTCDESFAVARHIDRFADLGVQIPISSHAITERLENKWSATELALSLGIPVPATIAPRTVVEIFDFARQHGYPVVLKKCHSSASQDVHFLQEGISKGDLDMITGSVGLEGGQYILQAFVRGETYGASLLMNHGKIRARFVHKRLREMHFSGGPSTTRVSTRHPVIEAYAERLLTAVDYHGVAMVEFRHDPMTNQVWFIEVNPRFWGSVGLAIKAGIDFPYLLYRMALEGDVEPSFEYKQGYCCRWLFGEMAGIVSEIKATGRLSCLLNLFRLPDGYDDFYADDPLPFLMQFVVLPWRRIRRLFSR